MKLQSKCGIKYAIQWKNEDMKGNVPLKEGIKVYCRKGHEKFKNTLEILETEGPTVDFLPVTLCSNSPAYLQKSA